MGSDRASVSCYRPSIQSRKVSVAVCLSFEVKFWFPHLGNGAAMGVAFVVSDGASVTSYRWHYKALRCLLWFLCLVRPPGTAVPDGLLFYRRFFFRHAFSEIPLPIALKLFYMIGNYLSFIN